MVISQLDGTTDDDNDDDNDDEQEQLMRQISNEMDPSYVRENDIDTNVSIESVD